MSTATNMAAVGSDYIRQFERHIAKAKEAHAQLPGSRFYEDLKTVVNKPGWTSKAEGVFFEAAIQSLTTQMELLAESHQQLMAASKLVGE